MNDVIHYTVPGNPVTKKNSPRVVTKANGDPLVLPSAAYKRWEAQAGYFIRPRPKTPLKGNLTVRCLFYRGGRRRMDLANALNAVCDTLVKYGVLEDDNSDIVVSHDGSRVLYDKENPRTEIFIFEEVNMEDSRE